MQEDQAIAEIRRHQISEECDYDPQKLIAYFRELEGLPEDMALNHDHYLYGVPKKTEE